MRGVFRVVDWSGVIAAADVTRKRRRLHMACT
jgi:hypothetical protein